MKIIDGLQAEKDIAQIKELLMKELKIEFPKVKFGYLQQETNLNISVGGLFKGTSILEIYKNEITLYKEEYFKIIEKLSPEIEKIIGEEITLIKMYKEEN